MDKDRTMQQMMQLLVARMDADREERKAKRKADLEQMKADRIAHESS
jgi:hypothetical protein